MRQTNSKDLENIKRFQRKILGQFGSKEVNKNQAIKLMKGITSEKKFIAYLNELYLNKKTLTYKDFLKMKPKEGNDWKSKEEIHYQTTQRIMPDINKNKTISIRISPKIDELLSQLEKLDSNLYDRIVEIFMNQHFSFAASFIRYTNVSSDWIHIDAIQTDFFNEVRSVAMEYKPKGEVKKIFSKILGMEEDAYKYSLSKVKRDNPKVKVWTMNTPEMARKAEHIQSGEKVNKIYNTLPPKLGFKLINLEQLKKYVRIDLKNISKKGADEKASHKLPFILGIMNDDKSNLYKDFSDVDLKVGRVYYRKYVVPDYEHSLSLTGYQANLVHYFSKILSSNNFKNYYTYSELQNFSADLAHQVYNEIKSKYDKPPDYSIIIKIIEKIIARLSKEAEIAAKKNQTIWWANRNMLNETFLEVLYSVLNESKGPGTLYHYTNANNLKQILQKGYLQTRNYLGDGDFKTLPVVRASMASMSDSLSDNTGNVRFIFDISSLTSGKLRGARIRKISEYPVDNISKLFHYFKDRKTIYKEIDKYKKLGKNNYKNELFKKGFSSYQANRIIRQMNYFRENLKDREGEERIYLKNGGNIPLNSSYMKIELLNGFKPDFITRQLIRKNKNLFVDNNNLRKILS